MHSMKIPVVLLSALLVEILLLGERFTHPQR